MVTILPDRGRGSGLVGQQVSEGDPLYLLEEDSVSDLEDELQSNVEKAKADLEAVKLTRPCQTTGKIYL
ncbi:MAG: hypothetical protein ACLR7F_13075 [Waltera sp.]